MAVDDQYVSPIKGAAKVEAVRDAVESHPDLIDRCGDKWVWRKDHYENLTCNGRPGFVYKLSRKQVEKDWGPLKQVGAEVALSATVVDPALGDPAYLGLLDELRQLHLDKAADYGDGADPLANLRASTVLGIEPWVGCMLRCSDKMRRVQSLIRNGSLKNESIEDNLKDMAAYCLLALKFVKEGKAVSA